MIAFLHGTVVHKEAGTVWLDVRGVGYALSVSERSFARIPDTGEEVSLYTHLHVSEAGLGLYGFADMDEKSLFERLIGVSGIGPRIAIAALSVFSPAHLAEAISSENATALARIPGIGKKTAQRIILELKGSLDGGVLFAGDALGAFEEEKPAKTKAYQGAWEALLAMGFTSQEAELALKDASEKEDEGVLLRHALKRLGSQ